MYSSATFFFQFLHLATLVHFNSKVACVVAVCFPWKGKEKERAWGEQKTGEKWGGGGEEKFSW